MLAECGEPGVQRLGSRRDRGRSSDARQSAWAAVRKEGSRFAVLFDRLKPRQGARRAICAVAAEMLRTIYHMLRDGT